MVTPELEIINQTLQQSPIFGAVTSGFSFLNMLVGGLFGLAAISFFVSVYFALKNRRMLLKIMRKLDDVSNRLDQLEKKKK